MREIKFKTYLEGLGISKPFTLVEYPSMIIYPSDGGNPFPICFNTVYGVKVSKVKSE